ncbi:MAG: hypothetical protein HZB24_05310 [Desulfobacterales bacterium]|nr:hypothetical protein [Desulfobacterales bacterium]
MEDIRVECYSGYRGGQTPRRFWLGQRCVEVCQTVDCWLAPDHRYFKVMGDDGGLYILRHDPYHQRWEMTYFRQTSPVDRDGVPPS